MQKGLALATGAALAAVLVLPARAGSVSFDPSGAGVAAATSVETAISAFESTFAPRAGCVGPVSVIFEILAGRKGEYRTAEAVVAVNPDREVASMPATVHHELAHHVMISCRLYRDAEFTAAFLAAQGLPSSRGWFDDSAGWSGTPAEHFAEASVLLVAGSTDGGIPISGESVELVRRWINGEPVAEVPEEEPPTTVTTTEPAARRLVRKSETVPVQKAIESPQSRVEQRQTAPPFLATESQPAGAGPGLAGVASWSRFRPI